MERAAMKLLDRLRSDQRKASYLLARLRHCFAGSAGRMRTLVTLVRHLEVPISLVGRARRTPRTARRLVLVDDRAGDVSR